MKGDLRIHLSDLFSATGGTEVLSLRGISRNIFLQVEQVALVRGSCPEFGADCTFARVASEKA